jgi:hypothetical protein
LAATFLFQNLHLIENRKFTKRRKPNQNISTTFVFDCSHCLPH